MNKVKGNIKINIIDLPGFGPTKRKDTCEDLSILTGATVLFNEELGDDLDDMIKPEDARRSRILLLLMKQNTIL